MVEAAVSVPGIILTAMLLIRVFTFYLEILNTGISEHEKALDSWDSWHGTGMKIYRSTAELTMLKGGILRIDLSKVIDTRAYFFNEDLMVRAGEVL